ncbi:Uncharacterised protein [Kluyvera cryocrescens]|uniref:Uncharacterized protein n=1 Tax=Kluyvera cryocrescens TaxID=580 RepID=A0A485AS27_KLUCR|nr:Uncharacterised protein [Kluyvera cryocrescens]
MLLCCDQFTQQVYQQEIVFIGSVKTSRGWYSDRKSKLSLKGDTQMGLKR